MSRYSELIERLGVNALDLAEKSAVLALALEAALATLQSERDEAVALLRRVQGDTGKSPVDCWDGSTYVVQPASGKTMNDISDLLTRIEGGAS